MANGDGPNDGDHLGGPETAEQAHIARDRIADDRDKASQLHDVAAEARDHRAEVRDDVAEVREAVREEDHERLDTGAASDRVEAGRDRRRSAQERDDSASDRMASRSDRAAAAGDWAQWGLTEAQDALVRNERVYAIGVMASMIGHELRNPLQAAINALFLVRNSLADHDAPEVDGDLDWAVREIKRAAALCEDLTAYMRQREPVIVPLDLGAVVAEVLKSTPPPPGIEVTVEDLGGALQADKAQLVQMLTNIITNGYQAMPDGGSLRITRSESDGFVEITVQDSGGGIAVAVVENLFEPFFTTKATGIGLGLATVKHLAEGHGGTVSIENGPTGGARVTIRLPHAIAEATP
jgi:signal transduction histidine kinase